MSKTFLISFVIGIVVIGAGIGAVFYKQRGNHIEPNGSILKVRTAKLDDANSVAIAEVRLSNNANFAMVARDISVSIVTGNGEAAGHVIVGVDAKTIFKNYPELGEQFNPVFDMRGEVPPHSSTDREILASFTIPVTDLDQRKDLIVRIEDVTGPVTELHERRK
jgi:hypothetical protein